MKTFLRKKAYKLMQHDMINSSIGTFPEGNYVEMTFRMRFKDLDNARKWYDNFQVVV